MDKLNLDKTASSIDWNYLLLIKFSQRRKAFLNQKFIQAVVSFFNRLLKLIVLTYFVARTVLGTNQPVSSYYSLMTPRHSWSQNNRLLIGQLSICSVTFSLQVAPLEHWYCDLHTSRLGFCSDWTLCPIYITISIVNNVKECLNPKIKKITILKK